MRALTVRQPWAWAIIHGQKDVENRTRNIAGSYRGPVAIHAAARKPDDRAYIEAAIASPHFDPTVLRERHTIPTDFESIKHPLLRAQLGDLYGAPLYSGVILGVVDLVDAHPAVGAYDMPCGGLDDMYRGHYCSPWAMPGHHHLVLTKPRPLARPIPARGRLGLWRPDETLAAAIREQVSL